MKLIKTLALSALLALAVPASAMTCSFDTYIDSDDLYSSKGKKLTTVGQIIRQDRANLYESIGEGEMDDCGLDNAKKRETLQKIIDRSKLSSVAKNRIKRGNVGVSIIIENSRAKLHLH